jgi:hypothetical protein
MAIAWLAADAAGPASDNTLALLEGLKAQGHDLHEEVVTFWANRVAERATCIDETVDPSLRLMLVDFGQRFAEEICAKLRSATKPLCCCVVRGSSRRAILLGAETPPAGLSDWIVVQVEHLDLNECA